VLFDIEKGHRLREYRFGNQSIANGGVAPAGKYFAGINYGKITRSRKVISYAGATDWTADGFANPADDGLFRIGIATGKRELLISYRDLAAYLRVTDDQYPIYVRSPAIRTMRAGGDVRIDPAPRWNRANDAILVPGIAKDVSRQLFIVRIPAVER
jgi:hypothetical protein